MSRNEISEICRAFFCDHFGLDTSECVDTAEFYADFEADDLDGIELAEFVQHRFDIVLDEAIDVREITFKAFVDLVDQKINVSC